MKFQKGDLVYILWTDPERCWDNTQWARCRITEIEGLSDYKCRFSDDNYWNVSIGVSVRGDLLVKVPPEEHGRREEKEDQKPVETISSDC